MMGRTCRSGRKRNERRDVHCTRYIFHTQSYFPSKGTFPLKLLEQSAAAVQDTLWYWRIVCVSIGAMQVAFCNIIALTAPDTQLTILNTRNQAT